MAKTILIVDDSSSLRRVVDIALTGAGYEVIQAADGRDALSKLAGLGGKKVNLIISDVNMPNMNGIEFVTEVKKDPAYKFVPVIMLTTEGQDEVKDMGRKAGAKAWIVKPFNPTQMLNAVQKLILP
ncbi:response regulator [Massilia sp. W12]|uniref:response regulator n=1 Tax=Massilia sp. W12 TaxID=3126507 RepID=UPI0030D1F40D